MLGATPFNKGVSRMSQFEAIDKSEQGSFLDNSQFLNRVGLAN